MTSNAFQIKLLRTGTTVRIAVCGELDIATAPQLREHASRELADHVEIVLLDLSDVTFIDSTGLHALLEAATLDGNRLRVIPNDVCLHLFDVAGVGHLLPLVSDEPGSTSS
jgi:anti-anti-sigma factor